MSHAALQTKIQSGPPTRTLGNQVIVSDYTALCLCDKYKLFVFLQAANKKSNPKKKAPPPPKEVEEESSEEESSEDEEVEVSGWHNNFS